VQPALEEEGVVVSLHVEAKSDEDLSAFMNALERKGLFSNVWPMERQFNDSELQAVIKGTFGADSKDGVEVQPVRTPVGRGRDRK
jgi:hypothetical protein